MCWIRGRQPLYRMAPPCGVGVYFLGFGRRMTFILFVWVLGKVHLSSALDYPSNSMEQTSYSLEERCGIMNKKEILKKIVQELLDEDLLDVNNFTNVESCFQEVEKILEKNLEDYSLVLTSGILN